MCGICGWISPAENTIDADVLKRMVSVLRHRGPDDSGYWFSKNVGLGHTRLSIIDLNTGDQPMSDMYGTTIVFNGEIYNYRELRVILINSGVNFVTESDTEVILEAYKKWGEDCVRRLDGMFAFAIVDPNKRRLFLARDRFGKKPLHYFYQNGNFIFASEIKAILQHELVRSSVDVDNRSLLDYLAIGYTLSPKTIFTNIRRLEPASWAYLDWNTGKLWSACYWKLEDYYCLPKIEQSIKRDKETFSEIFSQAVKVRLHADVSVGAFLSSGLDSTSVVATAKSVLNGTFRAFNVGFEEKSYDESEDVLRIAEELGIDLEVEMFNRVTKSDISRIVWHIDEPFSDNSAQPMFQLSELVNKFGKVALSGDGADELCAGYTTYRADDFFRAYKKIPPVFQRALLTGATRWLSPSYRKVSMDYKIRQFVGSAGLSREEAHYWWRVIFPFSEINRILNPETLDDIAEYRPFDVFDDYFGRVRKLSFLDQTLYVDAKTWMLDDILIKVDRTSMAHSVEVRCPFLDHHLAEYIAQLPTRRKMSMFGNKRIIRQSMSNIIPNIARNSKKKGFNSPPIEHVNGALPLDARFQRNYALRPDLEDVTFKMNNLLALNVWFDMFSNYKKTGLWEPVEYGDST